MKFEESENKSCACIYELFSPDVRCYVGMTKNLCK